ncbi:MAG TPA: hypothetical protein VHP83_21635 [Aggregatilineaceae bacterium]|nr:hypothetical protein [Aggregatilineaceae bacterium]
MVDSLVQQAITAYKANRKAEARDLLMKAVDQDEYNEQAWLWLSAVVDSLDEQKVCLENVISINPNNERARKGLASVEQKLAASPAKPAAPPSGSGPIGAEFESFSGDQLLQSTGWDAGFAARPAAPQPPASAEPAGGDWASFSLDKAVESTPDPFGSTSSVDWAREGPAAYGSGKQVDLPSSNEYDEWLRGLNLPGGQAPAPAEPAASASPFIMDDTFGDTSFMVDETSGFGTPASQPSAPSGFGDDLFNSESASAWGNDSNPFGSVTEDEPAESPSFLTPEPFGSNDPFASSDSFAANDPFGGADSFDSSAPSRGARGNDFGIDSLRAATSSSFEGLEVEEEEPMRFDFDEEDDAKDFEVDFGDLDLEIASPALGTSKKSSASKDEAYFQYIPKDIEAKASGVGGRSLMLLGGVLILAVLNIGALLALLAA